MYIVPKGNDATAQFEEKSSTSSGDGAVDAAKAILLAGKEAGFGLPVVHSVRSVTALVRTAADRLGTGEEAKEEAGSIASRIVNEVPKEFHHPYMSVYLTMFYDAQ